MGHWQRALQSKECRKDIGREPIIYIRNLPFEVGQPLWVKETWCCQIEDGSYTYDESGNNKTWYRSTNPDVQACDGDGFLKCRKEGSEASPWQSALFLPRWASRLTLEIVSVRAERVQDISLSDCQNEGVMRDLMGYDTAYYDGVFMRHAFSELWDSINGKKHPWSSNPWVWVIEFKTLEAK